MRASKLRQRITIYDYTTTQDDSGDIITEWIVDRKLWASIEPLSVRDVLHAKAADSQISMRCILRYQRDITSKNRIEYDGRVYEIDGDPLPDPISGREYMTLALKEVTDE